MSTTSCDLVSKTFLKCSLLQNSMPYAKGRPPNHNTELENI